MSARRRLSLLLSAALLTSSLSLIPAIAVASPRVPPRHHLPAPTATAPDGLTRALANGSVTEARYALERAIALFHLKAVAERYGPILPDPRSATMILRDLALRLDQLPPEQRRQGEALLARPTDGVADPAGNGYSGAALGTEVDSCTLDGTYDAHFCFHWVTLPGSGDKVDPTDTCTTMNTGTSPPTCAVAGANGMPDYVDTVKGVMDTVWDTETGTLGFKTPKDDSTSDSSVTDPKGNPNGEVDIFLENLLPQGLYGYCTSDDPHIGDSAYLFYDVSAYCVLDNDYTGYGYVDKGIPLKVTGAHEFFHAVQFAYDWTEDRWFMEGTAVWMEDEVFDSASGADFPDDNYQYLSVSPLSSPQTPLDKSSGYWMYGTWIFWRFLGEYSFPTGGVLDSAIVKEIWENADASPVFTHDDYSTKAIVRSAATHGTNFFDLFATFGDWLAVPSAHYSEGAHYGKPVMTKTFTLTHAAPSAPTTTLKLNHMAQRFWMFKPGPGVAGTATLAVSVNGPAGTAPVASAVVVLVGGPSHAVRFKLNASGDGGLKVKFGMGVVSRVILVLGNAGHRFMGCYPAHPTVWSCGGTPIDNGLSYSFAAHQT